MKQIASYIGFIISMICVGGAVIMALWLQAILFLLFAIIFVINYEFNGK